MRVVVRRSAVKMWLLAIGAIPLLVISIDVLTQRRITKWLQGLIFPRPEDLQIYEPRDVIWAWGLVLFAGILILWGLKELFVPTSVVECRDAGLAVKLRGPLRGEDLIPWANVADLAGGEIEDEGDVLPVLQIKLLGRGDLPEHPWGARWVDARVLGILAQDWQETPEEVAGKVSDYAVDVARREAKGRTRRIWDPSS